MTRDEAMGLLKEYTKKPNLIKHALAVEGAMAAYAKKFGEDEESWRVVGLLHDFDYEKYPDEKNHPYKGAEILKMKGLPQEWIDAIMGHAEYTGVERKTLMAKTLYAVDELTGFIIAVALVRPTKKLEDVTIKSVKKKMKDKAFAAAVDRDSIIKGAEELGVELDDHIQTVLNGLKKIADKLGL